MLYHIGTIAIVNHYNLIRLKGDKMLEVWKGINFLNLMNMGGNHIFLIMLLNSSSLKVCLFTYEWWKRFPQDPSMNCYEVLELQFIFLSPLDVGSYHDGCWWFFSNIRISSFTCFQFLVGMNFFSRSLLYAFALSSMYEYFVVENYMIFIMK